jgi:predicted HNH restriction endonuclease
MCVITEKQLILPSLYLMNLEKEWKISTSDLKEKLFSLIKPTWKDLDILGGWRKDTKFSQKVRNLKSHPTHFTNKNLATNEEWWFKITENWKKYLSENIDILEYLIENDFNWWDIKEWLWEIYSWTIEKSKKVETFDENFFINEWINIIRKNKVYLRSSKLRNYAINHFKKKDWKLYCEACNFSYDLFYWKELAWNYIEIHHKKPIFQYEWDDLDKNILEALSNLSPLCASCHRMTHIKKIKILDIEKLKVCIKDNWIYN